jgi:hypothetical protein
MARFWGGKTARAEIGDAYAMLDVLWLWLATDDGSATG